MLSPDLTVIPHWKDLCYAARRAMSSFQRALCEEERSLCHIHPIQERTLHRRPGVQLSLWASVPWPPSCCLISIVLRGIGKSKASKLVAGGSRHRRCCGVMSGQTSCPTTGMVLGGIEGWLCLEPCVLNTWTLLLAPVPVHLSSAIQGQHMSLSCTMCHIPSTEVPGAAFLKVSFTLGLVLMFFICAGDYGIHLP